MASSLPNGLRFFGRIMAGVSHELNNVITVVEEVAGLLDDLILLAQRGKPLKLERLALQTEKIHRQVARGKALVKHMNRFSHSVDERQGGCNLRQELENLFALSERLVNQKQTTLEFSCPDTLPTLSCDAFVLKHTLFTCLMAFLTTDTPRVPLRVDVESIDRGVTIHLTGQGLDAEALDRLREELDPLLQDLAASLNVSTSSDTTISLTISG